MNPLRRPEVLALLLLTAGIGGYFLWSGRQRNGAIPDSDNGSKSGTLAISSAAVINEAGSPRLRVVYRIENSGPQTDSHADLNPRLHAADGTEVPAFFQPGEFPPDGAAMQAGSAAQVDFWLKSPPREPLTLEVAGLRQNLPAIR